MKLQNHIAYRLLTQEEFVCMIVETVHPGMTKLDYAKGLKDNDPQFVRWAATYDLLRVKDQRAYVITDTVMDKLDMLKVKKSSTFDIRKQDSKNIVGSVTTFDWTVFSHITNRKTTFILPDGSVIRMRIDDGVIWFCKMWPTGIDILWTFCFLDSRKKTVCDFWPNADVQSIEESVYKLLCFIYLSENEELIVQPGSKTGTRKSGKFINDSPVPVTVVTSKWNVTSIRTEGFDVSGHFRLQPTNTGTKMIFISPFRKHGYVRRAKSEGEK